MTELDPKLLQELSRSLTDEGKLIEAGWIGLRILAIAPNAPPEQIDEMRMAFMAGAQHLWSSIMTVLDPGAGPTDADVNRMDMIARELDAYVEELKARIGAGG